jgi:hypothetical protein
VNLFISTPSMSGQELLTRSLILKDTYEVSTINALYCYWTLLAMENKENYGNFMFSIPFPYLYSP